MEIRGVIMKEYDVVVIGGGPAGTAAAKVAAEKGCQAILLEEHRAIGLPRHCPGRIQASSFTEAIMATIDGGLVVTEYIGRRVYAPSGRIVQEISFAGQGVCLVPREQFDKELARQAVDAGAKIVLGTRVTGLLKEAEKIRGVVTNSDVMPRIYGKVIIAADGIRATHSGIPRRESLSRLGVELQPLVLLELERVTDLEPDVMETHLGAFRSDRNFLTVFPRSKSSCFITFHSMDDFERVRKSDYVISRKIRDAVPVQIDGCAVPADMGQALPKTARNNLILVGNAAGYTGIIHAVVSGYYAGEAAAECIHQCDISELTKYDTRCRGLGLHLTGMDGAAIRNLSGSNEAIESLLPGMAKRGELGYLDVLPF